MVPCAIDSKDSDKVSACCTQLYVRRHYFYPPGRITQYYKNVTSQVRAETQAWLYHRPTLEFAEAM